MAAGEASAARGSNANWGRRSEGSARSLTDDPDRQGEHVTIWNRVERRKIAGNAAPLRKNLERYLSRHPDCEVYDHQDLGTNPRRKKTSKPAKNSQSTMSPTSVVHDPPEQVLNYRVETPRPSYADGWGMEKSLSAYVSPPGTDADSFADLDGPRMLRLACKEHVFECVKPSTAHVPLDPWLLGSESSRDSESSNDDDNSLDAIFGLADVADVDSTGVETGDVVSPNDFQPSVYINLPSLASDSLSYMA
mmetsp:Transcript_18228/g.38054  ORF Transcript_18228/g.38054 Transcript_18228/m.38054 type:complete len:249 (+) Transcript_18228:384-1130(+)|eukprot:CAMPEP_0184680616 /NCGR_PEP_ID=MMETSP0312-20130426/3502_1 /TAXON_ID=31354 /ORGANISM="Compsopogon coeruleus, Strain SAG 36.94" /LENGTH=248 /DNA_ID=CAMNT_0027130853 /DNA_START=374 /DNA_END=1120 /DNA_ORIENTATION=+